MSAVDRQTAPEVDPNARRAWLIWLGLGVGCFISSELSLATPVEGQGSALFWLAAGLTLGTLTRIELRMWPGALASVFVACVISNWLHEIPLALNVAFASSNVIEPAVGASLFRWGTTRRSVSLVGQALVLATSGALACLVGATIGAASLAAAGLTKDVFATFSLWYINDLMGVVVVAPLLITWWPSSPWAAPRPRPLYGVEMLVALSLLSLAGYLTFFRTGTLYSALVSLYFHLALLLVCALRLGPRGATLCSMCISSLAVMGTLQHQGPFALVATDMMGRATALQYYLVATAFVGLVPSLLLAERSHATHSLVQREEEIAAILGSLGEGVIVTDTRGRIRYDNVAARRLLGLEEGETAGRPFRDVVVLEGVDRETNAANRVLEERQVVRSSEPKRLLRADHSERWTTFTGAPLVDASGGLRGAAIVLADETDRHAHATQLAETERQLAHAQKLRAVGDLAAGVAHDFNNILTAIQGSAQLLQFDARDDQQELIQDILDASNKAKQLTAQLAVFNRNDAIEFAPQDLNEVVSGMTSMLQRLLGEDVRLRIHTSDQAAVVQADRGQIEQVVVNLAINARDAMPVGGTLDIRIKHTHRAKTTSSLAPSSGETNEFVVVEVQDTGQGMDPVTRARIFEPFFTTKASGAGTGLGLATVQMVCDRHQGFVEVDSELGKGSTFHIVLPRLHAPVEPRSSAGRVVREGSGQRILVVEDGVELRAPIQRLLQRKGFVASVAEDAHQALRLIQAQSFDLLLTDVIMPEMNGKELADRVSAMRPELPVLFMSGYSDGVLGQRVDGLSGFRLLKKPFSADELTSAILKALKKAPTTISPEEHRA